MKHMSIAIAALLVIAHAPAVQAAAGEGIGKACVESIEARTKRLGKPGWRYGIRHKLCACMEAKVKGDAAISDGDKNKVREVFIMMASDRKKALVLRREMPKATNDRLRVYGGECRKASSS